MTTASSTEPTVHILRDVEGQFYVPPEDLPLVRRVRTVHGRAPRLALSYDQARHLTGLCIKAGLAVVVEI